MQFDCIKRKRRETDSVSLFSTNRMDFYRLQLISFIMNNQFVIR